MARRVSSFYDALKLEGRDPWLEPAAALLRESGCTIRAYSTNGAGTAYHHSWSIKVPRPTSPKTFLVFAHEVGHHMKGHCQAPDAKPRYVEEQEAHLYALQQFERFELPGRAEAEAYASRSMAYAFGKRARRLRGEVTFDRFPDVDPFFYAPLLATLEAGPEKRFYWLAA